MNADMDTLLWEKAHGDAGPTRNGLAVYQFARKSTVDILEHYTMDG